MDKFNFDRIGENFKAAKNRLPIVVANATQNYFMNSWKEQGFNGEKWQEVKRREPGTRAYIYPKMKRLGRRTSAILVRSGDLRRAVGNSIRQATFEKIELVVPEKYAEAHNEGNPKKNIPKRQFVGQTETLTRIQIEKITQGVDFIWRE